MDHENMYRHGTELFTAPAAGAPRGFLDPNILGTIIDERNLQLGRRLRPVDQTVVYAGLPGGSREPDANARAKSVASGWTKRTATTTVHSPLDYSRSWPSQPPHDHRSTIKLGVDLIEAVLSRRYDTIYLASASTALQPALTLAARHHSGHFQIVNFAAQRLRIAGHVEGLSTSTLSLWDDDYALALMASPDASCTRLRKKPHQARRTVGINRTKVWVPEEPGLIRHTVDRIQIDVLD
ncbi:MULTISPECIES: hypothetical protein [unclassified Frondihabitans]|uniref:hypothetical protein n=1 Tax=unclassified Frondihabitans TaxID=2626248 RepID=UPI000F508069|nr:MULTISPECIES: hypothetical protein [unclassified Frondihabitans]